jgi:hypothetical protein
LEFLARIFTNKNNGQKSLVIPKQLDKLRVEKLPPLVKVKITIPKDYLAKVKEIANGR